MPTKTKPKRAVQVRKSHVNLSREQALHIRRNLLGWSSGSGWDAIRDRLCEQLSEHQALLRGAPVSPLLAHLIAELKQVHKATNAYLDTLANVTPHGYRMMPGIDEVRQAVEAFEWNTRVSLIQMDGQPKQRGGAKRANIKKAREVVEHSLGIFWDLNAQDRGGVQALSEHPGVFLYPQRTNFIEYCVGLITPPA